MKKKSKLAKPRVFIPLLVLLLFYIGCGIYILQVGNVNTVELGVGVTDYVHGSLKAVSSDENIVRVTKISETPEADGIKLTFETEAVNPGNATVHASFKFDDSHEGAGATDSVDLSYDYRAFPFG